MTDAQKRYAEQDEIAKAHTRLNAFAAVVSILEGGCLPSGCHSADNAARKIIRICKDEQQRQLVRYDRLSGRDMAYPRGGDKP